MDEPEEILRRLSMHDERALALVVGAYAQAAAPGLDAKASALARLAATIALRGELPPISRTSMRRSMEAPTSMRSPAYSWRSHP